MVAVEELQFLFVMGLQETLWMTEWQCSEEILDITDDYIAIETRPHVHPNVPSTQEVCYADGTIETQSFP